MIIERLAISQVRNLQQVDLELSSDLNIILGLNASGKTSLLEAIHLLFVGKSFRTHRIDHIIQSGKTDLTVHSKLLELNSNNHHRLGISRDKRNSRIRYDGSNIRSLSELARIQPIILVTPESHSLITGGPGLRRRFMDWLLFHVEHSYHSIWSKYQHVLKQRNALLKKKASKQHIKTWDQQLVQTAVELDQFRNEKISVVIELLEDQLIAFFSQDISIQYQSGWEGDLSLALDNQLDHDIKSGFTTKGPHRADLKIRVSGKPAVQQLSRGQAKLLSILLELSQYHVVCNLVETKPIILIDDLAAELDRDVKQSVLNYLISLDTQILCTTTDIELLPQEITQKAKLFHVEHGDVKEVV